MNNRFAKFLVGSYLKIIYCLGLAFITMLLTSCFLLSQETKTQMQAEMLQESVIISVSESYLVSTRVDFLLKGNFRENTQMAFPETYWFPLNNFSVYWNEKKINKINKIYPPANQSYKLGSEEYRSLFVFFVPATNGIFSHSVMYQYDAPFIPYDERHEPPMPEGYYIEYILKTGTPWKGPIQRIEVKVETKVSCSQLFELQNSLKGKCIHGIWKAVYGPGEPENDIRLVIKKKIII